MANATPEYLQRLNDENEKFQDILLEALPFLTKGSPGPFYKVTPYKYIGLVDPLDNDRNNYLLRKSEEASKFMDLRPEQLSLLTPYIKLYTVTVEKTQGGIQKDGGVKPQKREEKEIFIKNNYEVVDFDPYKNSIGEASINIGAGGVESINYSIRNERPTDQDISLTIELVFDNLYSFLNSELTELITFPFASSGDTNVVKERILRLTAGWSRPSDPENKLLTSAEINVIDKMK